MGFQLGNGLQSKSLVFKLSFINSVKKQLGDELASHISRTFSPDRAGEAIEHYKAHMSEGKILLRIGS